MDLAERKKRLDERSQKLLLRERFRDGVAVRGTGGRGEQIRATYVGSMTSPLERGKTDVWILPSILVLLCSRGPPIISYVLVYTSLHL